VAFGGGHFSAEEIKLIDETGLGNSVKQVSGNDERLASFYQNAAAFVYPSFYEGFGLPPLEAMAQQCPVISSNTSSMPEVIGDAGEFFDPHSKMEMRSAIERVIFSSAKRALLVERGKTRLAEFSWAKCAAQTGHVYSAALK
jgi:glycosyltransferase involved in cell wall biosynthesis